MNGKLIIKNVVSKRTGKEYRAVWLSVPERKDRLLSLDWFKFACAFNAFDNIKKGEFPVILCEVK